MDKTYEGIVSEQIAIKSDFPDCDLCCRICLDVGTEGLIFPCLCKGTGKFIHESCLKTWILSKFKDLSQAQCEICKFSYKIKALSRRECNPMKGICNESLWCCITPILILLSIIMCTVLFVVITYHNDVRTEREYPISILVICTIPTLGAVTLLGVALYKVCIVTRLEELSVSSYIRPMSSIDSAPEEICIRAK